MRCFLAHLDEKHKVGKFWEKFRKFSKNFFRNLWKCFILAYFLKDLTNPRVHFSPFGQKTQIVGQFWENFENFWWKFNWKIEFYYDFWKTEIKRKTESFFAFGNKTIFLQQFFRLLEGIFPPPPPKSTYDKVFLLKFRLAFAPLDFAHARGFWAYDKW